jgi:hypothetical protein
MCVPCEIDEDERMAVLRSKRGRPISLYGARPHQKETSAVENLPGRDKKQHFLLNISNLRI